MAKPMTELTDRELDKALERLWRRHYELVNEKSRRKMIERYGTEEPELTGYFVELGLEYGILLVKAETPKEAADIALENLYCSTDNTQVGFHDGPWFTVESVEWGEKQPNGLMEVRSLSRDELDELDEHTEEVEAAE